MPSFSLKGTIGDLFGKAEAGALPELIKSLLGAEGLQTILGKLEEAGLGRQVASWLDQTKTSLPITADQIRAALGDAHVQQIARSIGIPVDAVLEALAKYLPEVAEGANGASGAATGGADAARPIDPPSTTSV